MKGSFMAQPAPYNQLRMAPVLTRAAAPSLPSHRPGLRRESEKTTATEAIKGSRNVKGHEDPPKGLIYGHITGIMFKHP